ncbi:PA0069 family radical SAM protein [Pseudovibrio exalbescens]|uniref:PA0069 family radical SAM protein n=1 Tax=Pseudovibrio exalbescens TaxID=197461 RepID=UPI0023667718|nr:PA0069 family radical SAM protein [Pseudovibrio exalbescens]MDD7911252.1 PA0069 family radical SAM protein [Pseudovibrio exalbescens]
MGKSVQAFDSNELNAEGAGHFPANLVSGRGAATNPAARFEKEQRELEDDGWGLLEDLPPIKTECQNEVTRTVITRNTSPDLPFDRSINPYRGCEHGCTYCFARPSHAYIGLSPGVDFETRLYSKGNAADVLERELSKPSYQPKPIAIGTNTDPYQPVERNLKIMRGILEVLERTGHPVTIVTKSALVLRDKDILCRMAERNLVSVRLSITTEDRKLARSMEPRASTPANRYKAIRELAEAGVPTGVLIAPVIPGLTDHELEAILANCKEMGAAAAGYILLRMPREVSELFKDWLLREAPGRYRHVLSLMRSMRGGKDYDAEWNRRMRGAGPYADQLSKRFQLTCKRLGLSTRGSKLSTEHFIGPEKGGVQLSLF